MVRSSSDVTGYVVDVVIALDVLDMWSVFCVLYVTVEILYSDHHQDCTYRISGQCCLFRIWVVGSKIAIGLHVLDIRSVLWVPYVGCGI